MLVRQKTARAKATNRGLTEEGAATLPAIVVGWVLGWILFPLVIRGLGWFGTRNLGTIDAAVFPLAGFPAQSAMLEVMRCLPAETDRRRGRRRIRPTKEAAGALAFGCMALVIFEGFVVAAAVDAHRLSFGISVLNRSTGMCGARDSRWLEDAQLYAVPAI